MYELPDFNTDSRRPHWNSGDQNMAMQQEPMKLGGTDSICKAYFFRPKFQGISHQNMALYGIPIDDPSKTFEMWTFQRTTAVSMCTLISIAMRGCFGESFFWGSLVPYLRPSMVICNQPARCIYLSPDKVGAPPQI